MWQKELEAATLAARTAGDILEERYGRLHHIVKKGAIDLVTEADFEAERAILEIIHHRFPGDTILSEESGRNEQVSERTWVIDPLDGTTNFTHGFPYYCVSIALELNARLVLGLVYNPHLDELFTATQGGGAYLNSRQIRVSQTSSLRESLLGTGFPYDIHETYREIMTRFTNLLLSSQGVRRPGSAAIDLAYVAAGRLDGFWEERLKPWDTAAGTILVREAGGNLSTLGGEPYTPYCNSVVAANPRIHEALLQALALEDRQR